MYVDSEEEIESESDEDWDERDGESISAELEPLPAQVRDINTWKATTRYSRILAHSRHGPIDGTHGSAKLPNTFMKTFRITTSLAATPVVVAVTRAR